MRKLVQTVSTYFLVQRVVEPRPDASTSDFKSQTLSTMPSGLLQEFYGLISKFKSQYEHLFDGSNTYHTDKDEKI